MGTYTIQSVERLAAVRRATGDISGGTGVIRARVAWSPASGVNYIEDFILAGRAKSKAVPFVDAQGFFRHIRTGEPIAQGSRFNRADLEMQTVTLDPSALIRSAIERNLARLTTRGWGTIVDPRLIATLPQTRDDDGTLEEVKLIEGSGGTFSGQWPGERGRTSATFNAAVAAGTDDAHIRLTDTDYSDSGTGLNYDGNSSDTSRFLAGTRFTGAGALGGATIDAATITAYFPSNSVDDMFANFYCDDQDNSPTFDAADTPLDRTLTTATVFWGEDAMSNPATSPDLASVVQELTDRPGFAGPITVIGVGGTTFKRATASSYDHATDPAPEIDVTYTAGGGGGGGGFPFRLYYQMRGSL